MDRLAFTWLLLVGMAVSGWAQEAVVSTLDKQQLLQAQTFWDNRDWDWYRENLPFLNTPDPELDSTYYYRWEVVTKHMTYGSPKSGYSFTEFIDRPFWSGTYGAISCPAGHQLYEVRWLRNPRYAQDYARYWFRTDGAQPRRYSTWLADSVWAIHLAQGDQDFAVDLLGDLTENARGWERDHFVPEVGLFWQTGHDDGMEFNITSRQTEDILRGAPAYRPSFNAYMYADAIAIAKLARLAGDDETAREYQSKAAAIKRQVQEKLWDPKRQFFFPMFKNDEQKDGHVVKALSLTYQTGQYAGSEHGRELIGYVPWQFNLPDGDKGFEQAWRFLMDPDYFAAPFGPTVTERHDPLFLVTNHCCWWSGQSWPYATTQTLVAMANLLNDYQQDVVGHEDYYRLLRTYALTHRKGGRPYIAEAANPDSGSWEGYDNFNHSEHYFHSGFCDLVITGLIGLRPRADELIEINPLVPKTWDHFALLDVPYHGRLISVIWDRTGQHYGVGSGLRVMANGKTLVLRQQLGRVTASLDQVPPEGFATGVDLYNFAVNNEGAFYPRLTASHDHASYPLHVLQDGAHWYHASPPNRWSTDGSSGDRAWIELDLGMTRRLQEVVVYPLDDGEALPPPAAIDLECYVEGHWRPVSETARQPLVPSGRCANRIRFEPVETQRIRVWLTSTSGKPCGLSELEAWGTAERNDLDPPPKPLSLATNSLGRGFPKVRASHTSRFDRVEFANDGIVNYRPNPHNRWTAYESTSETDWLEIEFGEQRKVARVDLHLYDDRGGVQPPSSFQVQYLDDRGSWRPVVDPIQDPLVPTGSTINTVTFTPIRTANLRVVFTHSGTSRSGVTEIDCWEE